MLCLSFLLLGATALFAWVYALLTLAMLAFVVLAASKRFREIVADPHPSVARVSIWRVVGRSAGTQIVVSGLSGLLGIITSKLIISHFGVEAYGQYGLLATLPTLIPFADLGIAAVIVNNIAASKDPRSDEYVRRTITSAFRVMCASGLVIILTSLFFYLTGLWPVLLGQALLPGGDVAATLCLMVFGLALPMGVGSRILVKPRPQPSADRDPGPHRAGRHGRHQHHASTGSSASSFLALSSYLASATVSLTMILVASRLLRPQVRDAFADLLRFREQPGVPVLHLAWPMLVQMIALPVAMQTGRIMLSHRGTTADLASYNLASQMFSIVLLATSTAGVATAAPTTPGPAATANGARLARPLPCSRPEA